MKDQQLRRQLIEMLEGCGAHLAVVKALEAFPMRLAGVKPDGASHTAWELLEHMRIAQWDILEFSKDARFESPPWPDAYWPATQAPPDSGAWVRSLATFRRDLVAMIELVSDPATDVLTGIPYGTGQTLLRQVLLVADHNAYHLGQLVMLQRQLEGGAGAEAP